MENKPARRGRPKRGRPKKLTKKEITEKKKLLLDLMDKNMGILSNSLKPVGISHWTYYKWLKEDPEFKKEIELLKEKSLDFVENQLFKLIKQGDRACIIFYLKTQGKKRGYIEHQQIEQEVTYKEPLILKVLPPSDINSKEIKTLPEEKKKLKE